MTSTVTNPFYLQWHAEGPGWGTWAGSATASFDPGHQLDQWTIPASPLVSRSFHFSTKQSSGGSYEVFAMITDTGNGRVYGARFAELYDPCQLDVVAQGSWKFEAGQLISGDPKIQISTSTKPTPCTMEWNGAIWQYSIDGGPTLQYRCGDPAIELNADEFGEVQLGVRDRSGLANACATYYADASHAPGTSVGLVQTCVDLPRDQLVAFPVKIPAGAPLQTNGSWQCTLNLFARLSTDKSTELKMA